MRRHVMMCAAVAVLLPVTAAAQTIAITGGRVHPVSGPPIENGTVLIRDGRIEAVGANVTIPAGAQRIDATGKVVTPGLINSATQLGLVDIGAVPETRDVVPRGREAIAASFRAIDALNPRSVLFEPAREEGVTSTVVAPMGGLIAGQAVLIDLVPNADATTMTVVSPLAMIAQTTSPGAAQTGARGELLQRLRELVEDARAFRTMRRAYDTGATREFAAARADLEALVPVVEGRLPLMVSVNRASDIQAVLRMAREFDLRVIIAGGAEAWMVASELAAARVPVLTGTLDNIPSSFTTLGARQENAALLQRAGVPVLVTGAGGADPLSFNVRNLRYSAGNAVAYGMSWDDALHAVTLGPAEAFGVADRLGSLRPGRVANVVVWSGDPFEYTTVAEHVFVRGRAVPPGDRQRLLEERYRTLPPVYRMP